MKEFKVLSAYDIQNLQGQMNEAGKEGFDVASPITSIYHPETTKEIYGGGIQTTFAYTELIVIMSREIVVASKETSIEVDISNYIGPNTQFRSEF